MKNISIQQKIWNAIRVFKTFSVQDIQHSNGEKQELKYDTVKGFVSFLERAGYLKAIKETEYRLIKNTGRLAPCVRIRHLNGKKDKSCFDRNTKEVIKLVLSTAQAKKNIIINERIELIYKSFKDKSSFKLRDIIQMSGNYVKAKKDLAKLQKRGLAVFIKATAGSIKVYKIINKEEQNNA